MRNIDTIPTATCDCGCEVKGHIVNDVIYYLCLDCGDYAEIKIEVKVAELV